MSHERARGGTIAIVDPYSSGALLAPQFRRRGWACLQVPSTPERPLVYRDSGDPSDFEGVVAHAGDLEATATELSRRGVRAILSGCELGVELADALAARLNLPGNGLERSLARRDKFHMQQAVAARGLRTAASGCARSSGEAMAWAAARAQWPVVVKPTASSGSDGVRLCRSRVEVEQACSALLHRRNSLGLPNDAVLVQEFLPGVEYVVDTVSCAGRHRFAAFWRYRKPGDDPAALGYAAIDLLPSRGEVQEELADYVTAVLDALGIRQGPAHSECVWTPQGPVLVEVGARLHGGRNPEISRLCCGVSQVDLTVESCVSPQGFLEQADASYCLQREATLAFLGSAAPGDRPAEDRLAEIRQLPSCQEVHVGSHGRRRNPNVCGWVLLVHAERGVIEHDLLRLRRLEAQGLFRNA